MFDLRKPAVLAAVFVALALGARPGLAATSIPIVNPGFEADVLPPGGILNTISGWLATSGGGDGVFHPTAAQYPSGVPEGVNIAYVNLSGNFVRQVLAEALQANTSYRLEVAVGRRMDEAFAGYRVQLLAGGVLLAEDNSSLTPAPGQFLVSTVNYTAGASDPQLGRPLEIALRSPGVQANFDDVRLTAGTCLPDATTLCFFNDRFRLTMDWRFPSGQTGAGQAVPLTDQAGLFYFVNPANLEMLIKMLNACSLNNRYWVFYAATTNVEFTVTVTDTLHGVQETYSNPLGTPAPPVQDTDAFATCP